ncbi:MAG: NAD(P)-binding domain-containing protein [Gammaproteobacteria bacterium]|jgi:putative flavoprotein involved in K+ transport|nr:NAD(P)-binding domain-containing protein [Gammaproteobacteria bacterium]
MQDRRSQRGTGAVDVVIIGAGHSGLAMSHCLSALSIEHVLLERGAVANSWRRERWDSLRLLTPNWMTRLPGCAYDGDDPDGYMDMTQVIDFVSRYAERIGAPVETGTEVLSVSRQGSGYRVITNRGDWHCRALVLASGAFNEAAIPAVAEDVPAAVKQINAHQYKNPAQIPDGGVLVVGASATGLQIAEEIHASGRPVTLAVGEHVRMPRLYRGRDVQWWMLMSGILDECFEEVDDPARVRRLPSPQLAGTPDHSTLDLNKLIDNGVRTGGRFMGVRDGKVQFSGSLRNVCTLADLKMNRMLNAFDEWATRTGIDTEVDAVERFDATQVDAADPLRIDLRDGSLRTIVWATGFRPDYSWLDVAVVDRKGQLRHNGGVVDAPGLYVMGLPFLRRRKSSFMHGAEDDARYLSTHLATYLGQAARFAITRIAV